MRVYYNFLVVWRCEETLLAPRANGSRLPRETRSWKTENERFRRLLSLEYCAGFTLGWKIAVGKKESRILGPNIPPPPSCRADVRNGKEKKKKQVFRSHDTKFCGSFFWELGIFLVLRAPAIDIGIWFHFAILTVALRWPYFLNYFSRSSPAADHRSKENTCLIRILLAIFICDSFIATYERIRFTAAYIVADIFFVRIGNVHTKRIITSLIALTNDLQHGRRSIYLSIPNNSACYTGPQSVLARQVKQNGVRNKTFY